MSQAPSPPPERAESRTRQVARNIRTAIEAGVLKDGHVLPSTRELADEWKVSVFTISEAMKILMEEGLVVSKSRSKRVVHAPGAARRNELRPAQPHVILIGGYAGSGKSELGRILLRETGWPMIDKDTITRPVVEVALEALGLSPNDRESTQYLSRIRPREYEAVAAATQENVACGNSAIVVAPFIREFGDEAWIGRMHATYAALNAVTTLVWVYCDADTMNTYLRHRGAARDTAKLSNWSTYLASTNIDFRPKGAHHVVDNSSSSAPLPEQARELLAEILSNPEATAS